MGRALSNGDSVAEILMHSAPGIADLVARLAVADGAGTHPFHARLIAPRANARDLDDAVHALCAVHGEHPDLIEIVAALSGPSPADDWLERAVAGFAAERLALAQLTAAAGPLPSTPGQAQTAAALSAEQHALEMLAKSERVGVGLGAAAALVIDWQALRQVLAQAADRFGVALPPSTLPSRADTAAALDASPAAERAIAFGAQQLFGQHRGLLSLLEARASARGE